jgi:DNA modification methylase
VDAKGIVLAGNGTLTAAQELGWTEIQIVRTELAGVEATAFAIADNRTAELAEWEEDKLSQVLQSLKVEDADLLAATGYDAAEVDKMSKAEVSEDEVPEPPAEPITKAGDLWILGEHRVLCGDSTKAEDVGRLMAGAKADSIVTDPPYGIGSLMHGGTWATKQDEQFSMMREWDATTSQKFFDMIEQASVPSVVWGGNYFSTPPSRCWLAWDKPEFPTMSSVELAWTNMDKNAKRIECPRAHQVDGAKEHATQKPVRVMAWSLEFVPDGLVYDPFLGSGTTLIAAEQLGRKCYGMEISPAYCDVIVRRWENLTGKKAVLEKPTT